MTELDSTTIARQRSGWTIWLIWIVGTCAGVVAMTPLLTAARSLPENIDFLRVIFVVVQLPGILVLSGAAQQFAMSFCLPREKSWFRCTLVGALAGIPMGCPSQTASDTSVFTAASRQTKERHSAR